MWTSGTANNHIHLMTLVKEFLAGYGTIDSDSSTITSSGSYSILNTTANTLTETVTIECTASAYGSTDKSATFSVTGDSDIQITTTIVGPETSWEFDTNRLVFELINTSEDETGWWNVGDSIQVQTVQGAMSAADEEWEELVDRDSTERSGEQEMWLRAPGISDVPAFLGMQSHTNSGDDVYNIGFRVAQNFTSTSSFENQLDTSPERYIHLRNDTIPYWIIANRRNVRIVCRITTVYQTAYLGFMIPYALPNQWPDPLCCMGTSQVLNRRFSNESDNHRFLAFPSGTSGSGNSGQTYREFGNGWVNLANQTTSQNRKMWPTHHYFNSNYSVVSILRSDLERSLYPLIIWKDDSNNPAVYGELEGCYWITGEAIAAEDELVINGDTYLVVQDIFRTSVDSYMAFLLEE